MLKKGFHIFLAITVLASSMGFTVYERLCNMRGHQITLSADHGKCCDHHKPKAEKPKLACCKAKAKPVKAETKPCCSHKAIFMQAHAGAPVSVTPVLVTPPIFLAALHAPVLELDNACANFPTHSFDSHPKDPPDGRNIRVLFQSFRC